MTDINKLFDKTKIAAFLNKDAAFFGPLLCSIKFRWSKEFKTAGTNGDELVWNPDWFISLTPDERVGVLLHELQHIARLHSIRKGNREQKYWNIACDIVINNDLRKNGYSLPPGVNAKYTGSKCEEEIYEQLMKCRNKEQIKPDNIGGDLKDNPDKSSVISKVVKASQMSKIAGKGLPDYVEEKITQFTRPKLKWTQVLRKHFTELFNIDYSWSRPNRRFHDVYLPSVRENDDGKLTHVVFFIDVSGSITKEQIVEANSELKYIHDVLQPDKLSIIQFSRKIVKSDVFTNYQSFKEITISAGGGTSLNEVYSWIKTNKPTVVVIFTDLYVEMMPNPNIPVYWIISSDENAPYGVNIHV